MLKDSKPMCIAIVLVIKAFVSWRSCCRRRHVLLKFPNNAKKVVRDMVSSFILTWWCYFIDSQVLWYLLPLSWRAKRETVLILVSCWVRYWLELVMMHTVCVAMQPEKQLSWMKQEKSVLFWGKKMRSVSCIIFSFLCKIIRRKCRTYRGCSVAALHSHCTTCISLSTIKMS